MPVSKLVSSMISNMRGFQTFLVLSVVVIGGMRVAAQPLIRVTDLPEPDSAVSVIVVGDWGRHGEYGQRELAAAMAMTAAHFDIAAVISTGDNFYPDGVASTQDPAWKSSFEDVYSAHALHVPWYSVLGNHDYHGSVQAQIDYSQMSRRWTMPDRYFTTTIAEDISETDSVKVSLVFLDTNPFQKDYLANTTGYYTDVHQQDTAAQMAWMRRTLAARDTSAWCLVIGHHPMYTGGRRKGKTTDMIDRFNGVFASYDVDAYFAGHEHDLQHHDDGTGVQYFVSGAGSEVRKTGSLPITRFAKSVGGFALVTATPSVLVVRFVDAQGQVLYTTEMHKR